MKPTPTAADALALLCRAASASVLPTMLRVGGEELDAEQRAELLRRSKAGEHVELTMDIRPFSQLKDKPNRRFVRFADSVLAQLGKSGLNTPFMRDHDQGRLDAIGGNVESSTMAKVDGGHELRQTVRLTQPWAVQGALTGTVARFSIGWNPTGPVLCSHCGTEILSTCYHWPGDRLDTDDGSKLIEWIFTAAELVETSAVAVPAVVGTKVDAIRAALTLALKPNTRDEKMPKSDTVTDSTGASANVRAEERSRVLAIQAVAKKLNLPELGAEHVATDTSADRFRELAMDAYEAAEQPAIKDSGRLSLTAGEDARDKNRRAITQWLLAAGGRTEVLTAAAKKRGDSYDPGCNGNPYRGMRLMGLLRASLQQAGCSIEGRTETELVHTLLSGGHSGYQTSGDFVVGLENALNKQLLARYETTQDTWSDFCATGTATDFRPLPRHRRGSLTRLERLAENGEIRNKQIPDTQKELNQVETFANIIALTREVLINDDMGFLMDVATDLGTAASDTIELTVYDLLAENAGLGPVMQDGKTLFHVDHGNIGTPAALSIAAVDADRLVMRLQTDISNNKTLNLRPRIHIVSAAFETLARKINLEQNDFDSGATVESANMMRNLFRSVIGTVHFEGTRRYQFAEPSDARVIEVLFLDNQRVPFLQMEEGFRTPGIQWSAVLDIGVGAVGYRGAVYNAGA